MKFILITLAAMVATVLSEPAVLLNGGLLSSYASYPSYPSYASAALIAPGAPQVVAPQIVAPQIVAPQVVAPVAPVAPVSPLASTLADYSYAYGSSLTYQDRYLQAPAVVNSAYSLPYAYAADYYYRK